MRIYLYISIAILAAFFITTLLEKILKRNIKLKKRSKYDSIRKHIKIVIWCFIPLLRWAVVWSIYVSITATDDEIKKILHDQIDWGIENERK